jgi:uncharacterized protein YecT (DUF1311 family)
MGSLGLPPSRGRRITLAGAAIAMAVMAIGPAPVAARARPASSIDSLDACLSTPKARRTESGYLDCIEPELEASRQFEACMATPKARRAELEAINCYSKELDRTYLSVNRVYADLVRRLPPSQARALRREQKGWSARRFYLCQHDELRENDLMCSMAKNTHRTKQLRRRLNSLSSGLRRR